MMAGAGGGGANRGGGSSWWRLWETAVVAQVARSRELSVWGGKKMKCLKNPSPPSFYKAVGSRRVTISLL